MDLQQALDLMRQVREGPRFRTGSGVYFYEARAVTEDGEDFKIEVRYDEDYPEVIESEEQARDLGYLASASP